MRIVNWFWVLGCLLCVAAPVRGADAARGRLLYEARCTACHDTSVHQRSSRKATTLAGLRMQVVRWNAELGSGWSADEIDDVTSFLNERYYAFPCSESVCRGGQVAGRQILFHSSNGDQ